MMAHFCLFQYHQYIPCLHQYYLQTVVVKAYFFLYVAILSPCDAISFSLFNIDVIPFEGV